MEVQCRSVRDVIERLQEDQATRWRTSQYYGRSILSEVVLLRVVVLVLLGMKVVEWTTWAF